MKIPPENALTAARTKWWWRLAANFAPNPRVFSVMIFGWVAELLLLGCVHDNIYEVSWRTRWLAVIFIAWFWMAAGWVLWWGARRLAHPLARAAWKILLAVGFTLYGLSWGVYLRTSRFPDGEAVRFAFGNMRLLWMYCWQAEHGIWFGIAATVVGVGTATIGGGSWLSSRGWPVGDPVSLARRQRLTWYGCGLSWALLLLADSHYQDLRTRWVEQDAVRNYLNPAVTMASSWTASRMYERIELSIDPSELRPLSQVAAWNQAARVTRCVNVILITIESLRHDAIDRRQQGREIMPTVNTLAHAGVWFTRFYSQTTHSDYSTTTFYSSLFPLRTRQHLYFHEDDPWPKTLIYDVLKMAGYGTAIVSSQNEAWGRMDNFLRSPGLDLFYDPQHSGGPPRDPLNFDNLPDRQTMDRALEWVAEETAQGTPFFLGLNLQTSHFPYTLPSDANPLFTPATIDFPAGFFDYPVDKTAIMRNAYDNALHECDRQIGRLLEALRTSGQLSNTVIIVNGDHGEAFHEHGYVTHAREPIEPVIRTACVVYAPGTLSPRLDDYPTEQVDIPPIILGILGLPPHPAFQGIDVLSASRPPLDKRLLFFHTQNPSTRSDGVLWMGRWKYVHDRLHDEESLFDVETDPGETNELSAQRSPLFHSLRNTVRTWRQRQLAYYYFPAYYQHYLPPSPPPPGDGRR